VVIALLIDSLRTRVLLKP